MLNEYLSEEELHTALSEFLNSYNFFFAQLRPEESVMIYQDKKLLARLHHALNIEKYGQRQFMQKLLIGAPANKVQEFVKATKTRYDTYAQIQTEVFRNNLASFQWGNNLKTKAFVHIFGYPDYLIPSGSNTQPAEDIANVLGTPFRQLKEYQAEVAFEAIRYLKRANIRFLIHMPTGSGKTRTAMEIIADFLNEDETRSVIWLAERAELCEQAMETFVDVWSHLGKQPISTCRLWGKTNITETTGTARFTVAMYQKIRGPLKQGRLTISADLIVTDEAHNAIASTYSEIIEAMTDNRFKQTRIMGLTATPGRGSNDIEENLKLGQFFGGNVVSIKSSEMGTIEFLRRNGILARCVREPLNINIQYTLTTEEWNVLAKNFEREFPDSLLEKIAKSNARNMKIVLKLIEIADKKKHVLVFCTNLWQSKLLCGVMIALGCTAVYVDGNSPHGYRKDVVGKFRKGDIQFVFNYGVFSAGFDAPNIDAVVIARPTTSVVLYSQMIGRGMRGPVIGGTSEFLLIDVVDDIITDISGLDDVYDYFSEYWE